MTLTAEQIEEIERGCEGPWVTDDYRLWGTRKKGPDLDFDTVRELCRLALESKEAFERGRRAGLEEAARILDTSDASLKREGGLISEKQAVSIINFAIKEIAQAIRALMEKKDD